MNAREAAIETGADALVTQLKGVYANRKDAKTVAKQDAEIVVDALIAAGWSPSTEWERDEAKEVVAAIRLVQSAGYAVVDRETLEGMRAGQP